MRIESGKIIIDRHGNKIFLIVLLSWIALLIYIFVNLINKEKNYFLFVIFLLVSGMLNLYLKKGRYNAWK